ncbi:MAG: hypothetical protein NC177_13690 [Ruminococcus flavefaciens]|nr:hypothetical protein [Ruminococcus flavefaciens]
MKNRVLSVLLSIGIILSNFSTGFVVIAEGDTSPTEITTGEGGESGVGTDNVIDPSESTQPGNNNVDEPGIEPGNDSNAENPGDMRTVINVSNKENENLTIYNGQEDCLNTIYNNHNNDDKPRYSDYFEFTSSDWSDEMYKNIEAKFKRITENTGENEVVYSVDFAFKNAEFNDTYKIECEEDFSFALSYDYNPNNIPVDISIGDDGKMYLKCSNNDYAISTSSAENTFSESTDTVIALSDSKVYYLRNINSGSTEYHAISTSYPIESKANIEISHDALITQDIDLSKTSAYNGNVQITITAYAMAETATISLQNNNVSCFSDEVMKRRGTENGKNKFEYTYTFVAPSSGTAHITNLKVQVSAGEEKSDYEALTLKDQQEHTCTDLRLERVAPKIIWTGGQWSYQNTETAFQIRAWDNETDIVSVEYSFDKTNWTVPFDANKNHKDTYGNEVWFTANIPTKQLKSTTLYIKAIDEAGNINIIYRDSNGAWAVEDETTPEELEKTIGAIENIGLYYYDSTSKNWIKISSTSTLKSNVFGNTINKPLQIRVDSDETNKIYVNGNLMETEYTTDAETAEKIFDYFYYNFDIGADDDVVFTINGVNVDIPLNAPALTALMGIELKSNHITIESIKPSTKLTRPDFASLNVSVSNKWYGIKEKDGFFTIDVSDNGSGIYSIYITDDSGEIKATEQLPIEFNTNNGQNSRILTNTLGRQYFDNSNEKVEGIQIKIPVELFNDGSHILNITVKDNAGNTETGFAYINGSINKDSDGENKSFEFSTDFTVPTGTVAINTTSGTVTIGDNIWFDESEVVGFNFSITDAYPNKVQWKANSNAQTIEKIFSSGDTMVSASLADTTAGLDDNHSYTISAVFYDQAGNASVDGSVDEKTFYKDTEDPIIDSVSVSRAPESGIGKVQRILTFGIFANDNVTITVKAHDAENDSGLNSSAVEISLDKGDSYNTISNGKEYEAGKWEYKYSIPVSNIPQSGYIAVRVTDQFGHYSEDFDQIYADGEIAEDSNNSTDSKYYMLETVIPFVSIELPESDGVSRTDDQVWYNSDKDIVITVSDADSGIHNLSVYVNDEQITRDSNNTNFIWESAVKDNDIHEYHLSTEALREILRESGKLPADGHYVIKVEAEDNAGNKNDVGADTKDYYLDYDAPEVQKIDFSLPSADGDVDTAKFITELEYGFYFKTDLVATVNVTDNIPSSGLHRIEYVLIDYNYGVKGEEHPGTAYINEDGKASFNIHANFKGQILVKAFDYVENESMEKAPELFVVDTPERHESEQHIEITGMGQTSFTDAEGNPLFSSDVNLTVTVSDTMSGIREVRYSISSENDTQSERSVVISNTGNSIGQDLGDGWVITAMDENLVTEVVRNYTFSADDNNIQLSFGMTDRANNESSKDSDVFSVDQTAPIINVVFDNPDGNGEYYRRERTATITVIERNFDSARIIPSIQNEFGGTPTISSFTDSSNTEHVATITFGEGDYTFDIDGTDRCDHAATVNYSGGNERSFRVDLTDPRLVTNFDQFINDAQNSFNVDKEMTLTITEHNFVPGMVAIHIYRTEAGKELTTANREECTADYISADKWQSTGDTHTINFTFSSDYVYQVVVGGTDASGRIIADSQSPVFEIDKTKPVLKTPKNLDVLVYTIKNTETEAAPIVFDDSNIDRVDYTIVSYRMKLNEDNVGYDMEIDFDSFSSPNETVKINNEFFNQDGIYEVKCVPYDIAGNAGDETTHTYVIQRDTDFLVYIPNSNKEKHTGLYKFDEIGVRSADFEDIEIISYVTKDKAFSVEVDGTEVVDNDLNVTLDDRRINQIDMYDVTLKNSYIAQNFSDDTVDTDLTLNAVAKGDDSEQVITLGHIYIDNVKPVGEYEKSLQDIGFFDGFYGVNDKTVMIEGVSPDIDLSRCEIQTNDTTLTYESGGFDYDADAHTISFTINKGYTDIRPTLVDNAGNVNNLAMIKHVYVGNLFARWWYLFILGGLIVLAIPTIFIIMVVRKRKANNLF